MVFAPDSPRVAWLFTRERESVRIEIVAGQLRSSLIVKGPGSKKTSYDFCDMTELMAHQAQLEAQLLAEGYALERFTSDRRRWPR